ncbi:MAG: hypothetical protein Q7R41_10385 [Phycisphaerales bacterium]|nr:hypothetical protein [Phycisphaerales bacterium]
MKLYHVAVHREDNWYIGRVLERAGLTTQGRTLDELVEMLRDAIEALWAEKAVQLELILMADVATPPRARTARRRVSA